MEIQRQSGEILVAVSGHRAIEAETVVLHAVKLALEKILRCWDAEKLCVLTALADGADRLVIKAARKTAPSRFVAVLPMSVEDYQDDFDAASAAEFSELLEQADAVKALEKTANREEAYHRAGVAVLDLCDVLLAVWDGEPARGFGGTGDIVALARERSRPLAWVFATRSVQVHSHKSETGHIIYERFPKTKNTFES
jgi:hypothetical protein